jgi:hypothetical protein
MHKCGVAVFALGGTEIAASAYGGLAMTKQDDIDKRQDYDSFISGIFLFIAVIICECNERRILHERGPKGSTEGLQRG